MIPKIVDALGNLWHWLKPIAVRYASVALAVLLRCAGHIMSGVALIGALVYLAGMKASGATFSLADRL